MEPITKKKCTIIRGLPGTGKSTLAQSFRCFHIEADMFHVRNGDYQFDPSKATDAHGFCFKMFSNAIDAGIDVVVSNTFTRKSEFQPYIEYAKVSGYTIDVIVLKDIFGSIHHVPESVMEAMYLRWEDYDDERHVVVQ